jgi:arginyl-tRNA synthetase
MKKIAPEKSKRKEYGHLLTNAIFSSAKYEGKTDAQLEKIFAEEREEEQRRKEALAKS